MPFDIFGIKFFYPSKPGGFFYQMSSNPENDQAADWPDEMSFPSPGIARMRPSGRSTDFGIGKNVRQFDDSIGGCDMDFSKTAERGYAFMPDDARDVEIKCVVKISNTDNGNGFSISACTGHHTTPEPCCQGFAYMLTTEVTEDPTRFRFRKEMTHVNYYDSPVGNFFADTADFEIRDSGKFVGIGFCRYNDPQAKDEAVIVEAWWNPDFDDDPNNWLMIKRYRDGPNSNWGRGGDSCNGDESQVGTWSNAQNRFKINSGGGTLDFKCVSLREIDPAGSFGNEPPPPGPPPPPPQTGPLAYTFSYKFGSDGTGDGEFRDPHDIAFDSTGANLWVCDRIRNDIQKFTSAGVFVSKFGSPGSGNGEFNVPYAMDINPAFTHLYVCDRENNRVQKLTTSGAWVSNITSAGGKSLKKPEDICFNSSNGDIFICDTGNDRIVKLDSNHNFLTSWNGSGGGGTQFDHPHSMDITVANTHILVSCGNQPFTQKFTTSGTFVKKWGSEGNGQGQVRMFLEHGDIDAFDRWHLINNDVRPIINVWTVDGEWLCQYGKTTAGSADGQFKEPEHVTVHPNGNPFIVDAKNQRIQVFVPNFTTTPPPPVQPPPPGPAPPPATTKITGTFALLRDINITRISACEGTVAPPGGGGGGGGPGGGTAVFYGTGVTPDNETKLSDSSTYGSRTRHTIVCGTTSSVLFNKTIKQINPSMLKTGSPAATPVVNAKIWNSAGAVIYTSPTNLNPTTLPTSFAADPNNWPLFDFSTNTHVMQVGDRIGVEYLGTSDTNYVRVGYEDDPSQGNQWVIQYENGVWEAKKTRDFAVLLWQ